MSTQPKQVISRQITDRLSSRLNEITRAALAKWEKDHEVPPPVPVKRGLKAIKAGEYEVDHTAIVKRLDQYTKSNCAQDMPSHINVNLFDIVKLAEHDAHVTQSNREKERLNNLKEELEGSAKAHMDKIFFGEVESPAEVLQLFTKHAGELVASHAKL